MIKANLSLDLEMFGRMVVPTASGLKLALDTYNQTRRFNESKTYFLLVTDGVANTFRWLLA